MIHRTYGISNSWNLLHDEIKNTKHLLEKNMYPPYLIDKQIKLLLSNNLSGIEKPKENYNKEITTCHKFSYTGDISVRTKEKIGDFCEGLC